MSVSLEIPGDVAGIRELADYLSGVSGALQSLDLQFAYLGAEASLYLTGQSGNAFLETVNALRNKTRPVQSYLGDAASVLKAYATRLERGKRDFDSYLKQAGERGFMVFGSNVLPPICSVAEETSPEWKEYESLVRTYQDLCERVGKWWGELEVWIDEQMSPFLTRIEDFVPLNAAFTIFVDCNEAVASVILEYTTARLNRDLGEWRKLAEKNQGAASKFLKQLRSGNPGVAAAAEAANPKALRAGADVLFEDIRKITRVGKIIPVAGNVIEVVSAAGRVADGESGSSVAVETFATIGGGAAVGGVVAAAGGPIGWVAGGAVAGGVLIGAGAKWGWEATVPIDVRESIDGWMYDGTSWWQGPKLAE